MMTFKKAANESKTKWPLKIGSADLSAPMHEECGHDQRQGRQRRHQSAGVAAAQRAR